MKIMDCTKDIVGRLNEVVADLMKYHETNTKQKIAENIGVSKGLLSQILLNHINPSEKVISAFIKNFKINSEWLKYGIGNKYSEYENHKYNLTINTDPIAEIISDRENIRKRINVIVDKLTKDKKITKRQIAENIGYNYVYFIKIINGGVVIKDPFIYSFANFYSKDKYDFYIWTGFDESILHSKYRLYDKFSEIPEDSRRNTIRKIKLEQIVDNLTKYKNLDMSGIAQMLGVSVFDLDSALKLNSNISDNFMLQISNCTTAISKKWFIDDYCSNIYGK